MEASSLLAGRELNGTYRLIRPLGRGGMGEVWEAEHLRLPKHVAVKFLLRAGNLDAEWLSRFKREADIASRLRHPNIIEVHDFNVLEDGTPYLVMEMLVGQELRARLSEGPLGLEEARSIILQVASALSLAHREGVVHRDLKPENVFLHRDSDGTTRVKVLDFGISKLAGASATYATQENTLLGTPGYMAPEQAMGKHQSLDGRADLFSLAAILYEMLTGDTLFCGDSLAEVVYKVVHHEPEPLDRISPSVPLGVSQAVAQALSKEPSERQVSVQAFVAALDSERGTAETMLADTDASVPPPEGAVSPGTDDPAGAAEASPATSGAFQQPADQRKGWPWLAAGSAVGVAAVALGIWLWPPTGDTAGAVHEAGTVREASRGDRAVLEVPDSKPSPPNSDPPKLDDANPGAPDTPARPGAPAGDPSPKTSPENAADAPRSPTKPDITTKPDSYTKPDSPAKPRSPVKPQQGRAALPAELAAKLKRAEALLKRGDHAAALRLARSTLSTQRSARAFAVMAKSYCAERDLGMTRAMLRNLNGRQRKQVRAYCRQQGMSLE